MLESLLQDLRYVGQDVAIVNASLAKRLAPSGSALGMRLRTGSRDSWTTIIGVIRDDPPVLNTELGSPKWQIRIPEPATGYPGIPRGWIVARIHPGTSPAGILTTLRSLARQTDSTVIISSASPVTDLLTARFADARFTAALLSTLAGVALAIAAVGLFGVLSYVVAQRTRELGIRIALGASPTTVVRLVVGQALAPVGIGLAAGVPMGVLASKVLASLLYDTKGTDLTTVVLVFLVMAIASGAAAYFPARRAAKVDPMVALRYE